MATTGQVFLGLTVDCARCHDHKIDPIPQKDYYRLLAFFHNINHYRNGGPTDEVPIFATAAAKESYQQRVKELDEKRNAVQRDLTDIEREFRVKYGSDSSSARVPDLDDLHYRYYRDTFMKLPDFASLKPEVGGHSAQSAFRHRLADAR